MNTTWRKEIQDALTTAGETWDDIISHTMSEAELDHEFDPDYGSPEGVPFTAWTRDRVYFPACYDGSEWCASVPRNPGGGATSHVGGG